MSIKDDLREYAHSKGLIKYNEVKQKIVGEIKEEIAGCEKEVTVSWGSYGFENPPSVSLLENVMEEIDLPYDIEIDYDVLRLKIKIKELYED
ncbi:hypothetical protein INS20_02280 [Staphylococcus haemolyticus]|uniref:hypothetical protein n=1 Tax=Staphylococcus haemolyticus TaxID=1283 RepID=UPI00187A6B7E|nr:hypothetical protein [Staphylococcus haemolyticus]MBE7361559.1 hypothetical protein [Staphylococcus haemolyticus]